MLNPKKKISKKELKQDALITTYTKVTAAYEQYKKLIGIGLVVVVALILGILAYLNASDTSEQKAALLLSEIVPMFDAGSYAVAIEGVPETEIIGLRAIVDEYGGTTSGDHARFYLARALVQIDSYDEALEHFSKFSGDGDMMGMAKAAGMGVCYEQKGEYLEAAEAYEKAASMDGPENLIAQHMNSAARNYLIGGEREKAAVMYEKLKKTYPTSTYGRSADRFLAGLSG